MSKHPEGSPKSRKALYEKMLRIILRMLPIGAAPEMVDLLRDLLKSRPELEQKIDKAHQALIEASGLISELEEGLKERLAKLNYLKEKCEEYSQLAEIEEGKATAILKQIEFTMKRGRWSERTVSLLLNLLAGLIIFILGIWLGPYIVGRLGITAPNQAVQRTRSASAVHDKPPAGSTVLPASADGKR